MMVSHYEGFVGVKVFAYLGKPQKRVLFLVAGPLRGGGVNGCATKEKRTFFNVAGPLRKELFWRLPLAEPKTQIFM